MDVLVLVGKTERNNNELNNSKDKKHIKHSLNNKDNNISIKVPLDKSDCMRNKYGVITLLKVISRSLKENLKLTNIEVD